MSKRTVIICDQTPGGSEDLINTLEHNGFSPVVAQGVLHLKDLYAEASNEQPVTAVAFVVAQDGVNVMPSLVDRDPMIVKPLTAGFYAAMTFSDYVEQGASQHRPSIILVGDPVFTHGQLDERIAEINDDYMGSVALASSKNGEVVQNLVTALG